MKAVLAIAVLTAGAWGTAALATEPVNAKDGVAIEGYDAVAYFTEERAVPGSAAFIHRWRGADWYFASASNRDDFAADPERWAPRYGGWCAYAMAEGRTARIDPDAFTIHDGRLYLNYSSRIMKKWRKGKDGYIAAADASYRRLLAGD